MPSVALTKQQLQSAAGIELLELCQSVAEDGRIGKDEVVRLARWLRANRASDLPSVAYLSTTIEHIIADGKVSTDEVELLHKALESVLPPSVRGTAAATRRAVKQLDRVAEKASKARDRELQRDAARAAEPEDEFGFPAAGVRYEGRQRHIAAVVQPGIDATLERDPENPHSGSGTATRILVRGLEIGYVPGRVSCQLAPLLDEGMQYRARVEEVSGQDTLIPVVAVEVYRPDQNRGDARTAAVRRGYWAARARKRMLTQLGAVAVVGGVILVVVLIALL